MRVKPYTAEWLKSRGWVELAHNGAWMNVELELVESKKTAIRIEKQREEKPCE